MMALLKVLIKLNQKMKQTNLEDRLLTLKKINLLDQQESTEVGELRQLSYHKIAKVLMMYSNMTIELKWSIEDNVYQTVLGQVKFQLPMEKDEHLKFCDVSKKVAKSKRSSRP